MEKGLLKFITIFFLTALGCLVAIIFLSIWIDPRGLFGTGKFKPLVSTIKPTKLELLKKYEPYPDLIIFGSSRTYKMDPQKIEQLTDLRAFNLGVTNGKPEEFLAFERIALEDLKMKPKVFIVGIDHDALDNWHIQPQTVNMPELRNKLDITRLEYATNLIAILRENLTLQYLGDIARSLYFYVNGYPPTTDLFRPDGYRISTGDKTDPTRWDENAQQVILNVSRIGGDNLSPRRQHYFEEFLNIARKNNIHVIVTLLPFHPTVLERLNQSSDFNNIYSQLKAYLEKQAAIDNFDFYDFTSVASFGGDPNDFSDLVHIEDKNSNLILKKILKKYSKPNILWTKN